MKFFNFFILLFILSINIFAQDNVFIGRDFWKSNPTITQIEEKITAGNNPSQLNRFGFDAVVYALLENIDCLLYTSDAADD